ncbi:hypothetical protein ACFE04_030979 [Oxalis oulophora]
MGKKLSRICVKNLPKYVAEDRLRDFFSHKGEITDAKLMRTKDGKSRQFAFIGFRSEEEAHQAINYFDKTFLDTCRISCEIARKVGDENTPRPWSRHSQIKTQQVAEIHDDDDDNKNKLTAKTRKGKKNKVNQSNDDNDDPKLQEFLQVMQPRANKSMWTNDTLVGTAPSTTTIVPSSKKVGNKKETIELHAKRNNGDDAISDDDEIQKPKKLAVDEAISDMDYFKSRTKEDWSDSETETETETATDNKDEGKNGKVKKAQKQRKEDPSKDSDNQTPEIGKPSSDSKDENDEAVETCRLFVRNLPYAATEEELEEHFSKYGKISEVHLVIDKETKRSKGIAYILYAVSESAARAIQELDSSTFQGRLLHVMPAKQKITLTKQENDTSSSQGPKNFKQRREEQRKASEAGGDTKAWNSLFMRPDTVIENISRLHGVSKSELLDHDADDLAVRISLAETQVIAQTKKALTHAGVNVALLEQFSAGKTEGMKRSNYVILVKNLPYGSSSEELTKMFGKFGSLDKIILPPTKTMALIVFLEPSEACRAFKSLAYKRYKDVPLYFEWAPADIIDHNSTVQSDNKSAVGEDVVKKVTLEQSIDGVSDMDVDPDKVESRSVFVKNLNFKTSDDGLKEHFNNIIKEGKILSVKIKKHLKKEKYLSMGFGFIEFDSVETATNVCRDLQGTVLDGHALILQLCHAKKDERVQKKVDKDKSTTKLLVKNVAFEATEKDLRQLFKPFGEIKSLRLPMKFGNHRGFAFIEFITKQEAQNALEALSNTHLYGRHLVLERAKEGESLEELRARTAAQFSNEESGFQNQAKLSKKRKADAILDETEMKFEGFTDY